MPALKDLAVMKKGKTSHKGCILMSMRFLSVFLLCCCMQPVLAQPFREMDTAGSAYRGLAFLDTLLQGKRIVMLGESSHGTEQYSQVKFQLIRYLHEKLGYKVLLFEAPMAACSYLPLTHDTAAVVRVQSSLQAIWHTATVVALFRYAQQSGLLLGGFDPQFVRSPYPQAFYQTVIAPFPSFRDTLLQLEHRVEAVYADPGRYLPLRDSFSKAYRQLARQLESLTLTPEQQWVKQLVAVNSNYYAGITRGETRDQCMAANITWLAENLYKDEKIIIWAHNTHIDKRATAPKRGMGKALAAHFKDQLYGIGLFMVNGTTALNNRQIITVRPPLKGSLEEKLLGSGYKITFTTTADPVFHDPMLTWHWGREKQRMILHQSFDAVILVNGVQPPEYLNRDAER